METCRVSAPGSIMLLGEHAVVYGHSAIVCAINQRVTVDGAALDEAVVEIHSDVAPPFQAALDDMPKDGPLRFVCATIRAYRSRLQGGVRLSIRSEIDPTLGLGSSAAVTAACVGALDRLTATHAEPGGLHAQALSIVRQLQGRGSGADLAASVFGGVMSYKLDSANPQTIGAKIGPLPPFPQLSLRYVGYKTPTPEVLVKVADRHAKEPVHINKIYAKMGDCAARGIAAAHAKKWFALADCFKQYQRFMEELGVSDDNLDALIRGAGAAMAAKISGSGLGDCVVAMGDVPEGFTPAHVTRDGIRFHD